MPLGSESFFMIRINAKQNETIMNVNMDVELLTGGHPLIQLIWDKNPFAECCLPKGIRRLLGNSLLSLIASFV
jgi:hypothetical protein